MSLDKYALFAEGIYNEKIAHVDKLSNLAIKLWPVKTQFHLIRIGSDNDGGYLIPDDLEGINACFSPGVDVNASFEEGLLENYGINSHLADFSVSSAPSGYTPISFLKKYLGVFDDDQYITLDKWVRGKTLLDVPEDFLLQMDIEGGEYASILGASEEILKKFRIIVIEIHNVEAWGQKNYFDIVEIFFHKLLKDFYVIHNHPNNCCGIVNLGGFFAPRVFELTLLRKDRASPRGFCKIFPHALDRPNLKKQPDLDLPQNWYAPKFKIAEDSFDHFLNDVSGLIHIGANTGQERVVYGDLNLNVIWMEPIPEIFKQLEKNISNYSNQYAFNHLLTDLDDEEYNFNISNNGGQSSSILNLALHKEIWPKVDFNGSIRIKSQTFFSFVQRNKINLEQYQALILDTQGSELLVLKGCGALLKKFRYIKIEVSDFESYAGCPKPEEIENYLYQFGFKELRRETFAQKLGVGSYYNILYSMHT